MPASRVDERAWEGGGSCGLLRRSWPFPSAKSPGGASEGVAVVAVALGPQQTVMVAHLSPGVALDRLDWHQLPVVPHEAGWRRRWRRRKAAAHAQRSPATTGSPETLAGLVEPDGVTADRDHALGAIVAKTPDANRARRSRADHSERGRGRGNSYQRASRLGRGPGPGLADRAPRMPGQPRRLSVAEEDFIAARMAALRADRTAANDGFGSPLLVTRQKRNIRNIRNTR